MGARARPALGPSDPKHAVDGINPAPANITAHTRRVSWHTPRPPHFNIVAAPTPGSPVQDFRESPPTHGWHPYTLGNIKDRGCGGGSCVVKVMQDSFHQLYNVTRGYNAEVITPT